MGGRVVANAYEVLDKLGSGAYGVVWKARGITDGEIYALKEIKLDFMSEEASDDGEPPPPLPAIPCFPASNAAPRRYASQRGGW